MRILRIVFLVGALAVVLSVTGPYPLLGAGPMLFAVAAFLIIGAGVLIMAPKDEGIHASLIVIALFPWLLAGLFLGNGALDHSREDLRQTTMLRQDFGRNWDILTVRSWRTGRTTESLYIKTGFNLRTGAFVPGAFFFESQPIAIGVRTGAFGMTWISRISQGQNDLYYPSAPPVSSANERQGR